MEFRGLEPLKVKPGTVTASAARHIVTPRGGGNCPPVFPIREQIKAGAFPVRLKPDDWTSGEITWLLDVIAPSQKLATDVLLNFRKVLKTGSDVRIHPVVATAGTTRSF